MQRSSMLGLIALGCIALFVGQAGAAARYGPVFFNGDPGFAAPFATLGPFQMTPFAINDPHCDGAAVNWASGPNGSKVTFEAESFEAGTVNHYTPDCLPSGFGQGGGNNYPLNGDVWIDAQLGGPLTLIPSAGTDALYFYADVGACGPLTVKASTVAMPMRRPVSSPVYTTPGGCGGKGTDLPHYFGFYTLPGFTLPPITVSSPSFPDATIWVGEFGNHTAE